MINLNIFYKITIINHNICRIIKQKYIQLTDPHPTALLMKNLFKDIDAILCYHVECNFNNEIANNMINTFQLKHDCNSSLLMHLFSSRNKYNTSQLTLYDLSSHCTRRRGRY